MYKASEHQIGLLDFFNNHPFKNENGKIAHPSPAANGLLNSTSGWYEEQGIKVKGLVESAALQVDWWLLFNEPTEQYEFQWVSSGKYDIQFTDSKGKPVATTITKAQLEKYPDLLKRFNALQPTDMQFEIKWRIGDQTKADNDAFQKKYKLMGSIGSTLPHVKAEFTTQVKNSLLFEPSGMKPFAAPSIRPGKGKAFLGVPATYDDKKLQQVFAYWRISLGHVINSFRVTKANWPVQEMKTIAEKFLRYEKGEADPTPKEVVAAANEKNKNTPAYSKNDFWGDAYKPERDTFINVKENGKQGIINGNNQIIVPVKYRNVFWDFKKTFFIAQTDYKYYKRSPERAFKSFSNEINVYSKKGKELLSFSAANAYFLEKTNCIYVRTISNAFIIDLNTLKTIFSVAYQDSYLEVIYYFPGIIIPSDIVETFIVTEYLGPNCGDTNSNCGTLSKSHLYGITNSKEVRLLGSR
jgi:hypothetical protein